MVEIYALSSPLTPIQASERLLQLGSAIRLPSAHQQVIELELYVDHLVGAGITLQIEQRSQGSYVTAHIAENRFLADFVRVVRRALWLYAAALAVYSAFALQGPPLAWAWLGISVGLAGLLFLLSSGMRLAAHRFDLEVPRMRLRHQLASALCR